MAGATQETPSPDDRLDPYKRIIDGFLQADLDAPPKQKHTAKRIFDRLVDEHGAYEISYQMVRSYAASRRKQIVMLAGRGPDSVFIPQPPSPARRPRWTSGMCTSCSQGCPLAVTSSRSACRMGKAVHRVFASAAGKRSSKAPFTR
ncbi:hypothetical protein AB0D97_28240 [Streptomyces roseus]|uniref:hypothetical protein n=1 Tax=Streptomyces roseus TaxID=66430 RepID=UPI0033C830B2